VASGSARANTPAKKSTPHEVKRFDIPSPAAEFSAALLSTKQVIRGVVAEFG
jgi:hypothetical protein